jgi:imidazolonepropionase-like amidohydrolase
MKPIYTMGLVVAALLAVLLLLPSPETGPRTGADGLNQVTAIVNARLFDGDEVIEGATILIENGRVKATGPDVEVPAGLVPVDAAGKTVLPGLIDAHVHAYGPARTEALRFGVTTLLDMFRAPFDFGVIRAERDALAPTDRADLYSAGFLATAPGGHGTQYGLDVPTLSGPDQAVDWVAARKAEGSDWIKIVIEPGWGAQRLPTLDAATVAALVEAAHAEGLLAVAHVSRIADARMAVDAGVNGLVHLFGDEAIDPPLLDAMRAGKVFVVPTLAVMASIYGGSPPDALAEHPVLAPRLGALQRQTLSQRFPGAGGDGQAWHPVAGRQRCAQSRHGAGHQPAP